MLRRCTSADHQSIFELIRLEPEFNLFIIADIEKYGVSTNFLAIWGDFQGEELKGVLLKYHTNLVLYCQEGDCDFFQFVNMIQSLKDWKVLSGKKNVINNVKDELQLSKVRDTHFLCLKDDWFSPIQFTHEDVQVTEANPAAAEAIFTLRSKIAEFAVPGSAENIRRRLADKFGRTYIIKEGQKVLSAASTTAECSFTAMIGGVMTDPEYRGQGLSSLCVTELCQDLLAEGKSVCLFYNNPSAGSITTREFARQVKF